ncbi:alpha-aspartyl dipeptidase-like [Uloborus diversus]|uniref:alpha-aspartyl dipeptidase-like n=1 Tax=Uloborus diversus TaxID=327109 RepID=UPI0024096E24|nr:alpha-aspartyl dipeptidase-like [Uloborus diversus]XP_054716574.1 alpha-aspartyl dipeptidase-like [Uloborus diversus]
MLKRQVLLLSSTRMHGSGTLEWCADIVKSFFARNNVKKILFIPYANKDYDEYEAIMSPPLQKLGFALESIHHSPDPKSAVSSCEAIFIGGGNTFLLLKTLYEHQLVDLIRKRVFEENIPYMGSSAGSNVGTKSICTTNDMPICYPPSFEALKLVPFNINPHYLDPDTNSKHMGETREQRIKEYHEQPDCAPVLGLREGSCLLVEDMKATLLGLLPAKLFCKGEEPKEYEIGSDMSFLLDDEN